MSCAPRIAAIHDISGFGRCSMTVILPVLSVMGEQCCPLPTAYLSAHTGFPTSDHAVFLDMTGQMADTARHWKELDVSFDAIYTGFAGSAGQIEQMLAFLDRFRRKDTLVLVDPVMGDHGRMYRTYTPAMCRKMAVLAAQADVITPNLTEAALLLREDYTAAPRSAAGMADWLRRLSLGGRRSVVMTGIELEEGAVGAACFDRTSDRIRFIQAPREPGHFPGTGDLFSAVLLGGLLRGMELFAAAALAASFVQKCVGYTLAAGSPVPEGVQFEPLLSELLKTQ